MPSRVEQDSSRPGLGGRKTNPTSPGRSTHQRPHSLATTSLHQGVYTLRDGRQLELKGGGQLTVCWTGEGGTEFSGNLVQYPKVQVQKGKAMWAKIKKGKGKKAGRMSFGSAALAVLQKEKNGAAPSPDQEPAGEDVVSPSMTGILPSGRPMSHAEELSDRLLQLASERPEVIEGAYDVTGANALHCLLLANTDDACALAWDLVKQVPNLLNVVHVSKREDAAAGFFAGEGALHIAAVNRREEWILDALDLAVEHWGLNGVATVPRTSLSASLSHRRAERYADDRLPLLCQQCVGEFFGEPPMSELGGSVLAYAAVFNLTRVLEWVATAYPHAKDRQWLFQSMTSERPSHSGHHLSVLQAVVVNSSIPAFDMLNTALSQLTTPFPALIEMIGDARGDILLSSHDVKGDVAGFHFHQYGHDRRGHGLTPLRLAAEVGSARMFSHILAKYKQTQWKWGAVSQYIIPLYEIDTFGQVGSDQVLEILTRQSASRATRRLLSDECLNGFLFEIVLDKWMRWARSFFFIIYLPPKILYTLFVTALAAPSTFHLPIGVPSIYPLSHIKAEYVATTQRAAQGVAVLGIYLLVQEVIELVLYIRSQQFGISTRLLSLRASDLLFTLLSRNSHLTLITLITSLAAVAQLFDGADLEAQRALESTCVLLAIGSLFAWIQLTRELFLWHKSLGIFAVLVGKMLSSDVARFMLLYIPLLLGFGTAFTALFPEPTLDSSMRFSSLWSSLESLIVLSLVGEPPETAGTNWPTVFMAEKQEGRPAASAIFFFLYFFFLVMVLVLMLNMLIAMMGMTFNHAMENAVLTWRLNFSRLVLRLEALGSSCVSCASSPLSRTIQDPTYWNLLLSHGTGARRSKVYTKDARGRKDDSLPVGHDVFYVFRTVEHEGGHELNMFGARQGDPFRERVKKDGNKDGHHHHHHHHTHAAAAARLSVGGDPDGIEDDESFADPTDHRRSRCSVSNRYSVHARSSVASRYSTAGAQSPPYSRNASARNLLRGYSSDNLMRSPPVAPSLHAQMAELQAGLHSLLARGSDGAPARAAGGGEPELARAVKSLNDEVAELRRSVMQQSWRERGASSRGAGAPSPGGGDGHGAPSARQKLEALRGAPSLPPIGPEGAPSPEGVPLRKPRGRAKVGASPAAAPNPTYF